MSDNPMNDMEPYNGPAAEKELPAETLTPAMVAGAVKNSEEPYGDPQHNLSRPASGDSMPMTQESLATLGANKPYGSR